MKLEPGHDSSHFCKPTHVQVLNSGKIAVADGYCNSRVMVFDATGEFENEASDDSIRVAHSLVVDECQDSIFVADRENSRILEYGLDLREKDTGNSLTALLRLKYLICFQRGLGRFKVVVQCSCS